MKAPLNRKVVVVGYGAATALGNTFAATWEALPGGTRRFSPDNQVRGRHPQQRGGRDPGLGSGQLLIMSAAKKPRSGMPPMSS